MDTHTLLRSVSIIYQKNKVSFLLPQLTYKTTSHQSHPIQTHIGLTELISTNNQRILSSKVVNRNLKIKRSRTFPYTAGNVIMGSMAWTEPSTIIPSFADGHTSKMRADSFRITSVNGLY